MTVDPVTGIVSGSPDSSTKGTTPTVTLAVTDPSGAQAGTSFVMTVSTYGRSSLAGSLAITEVLYAQSDEFLVMDEFIEVTNVSTVPIPLTDLRLRDHDPVDGLHDFVWVTVIPFDTSFEVAFDGTILQPGESAIVWTTNPDGSAGGGPFPPAPADVSTFELNRLWAVLDDTGDDLWLLDSDGNVIDFVAWDDPADLVGEARTRPPAILGSWDGTFEALLMASPRGTSLSMAVQGASTDLSACWEWTGSGVAAGRCLGAQPTVVKNEVVGDLRFASVGRFNFSGG